MNFQLIKSLILILIPLLSCEPDVEPLSLFKEKSNLEDGCSRRPGYETTDFDLKGESVPFSLPLKDNLSIGSILQIEGIVVGTQRFSIDLEAGDSKHVALRLHYILKGDVLKGLPLIKTNGVWSKRIHDVVPLSIAPGSTISIMIHCGKNEFQIVQNKNQGISLKYQMNPKLITDLRISGGISISNVSYCRFIKTHIAEEPARNLQASPFELAKPTPDPKPTTNFAEEQASLQASPIELAQPTSEPKPHVT